MENESPEPEEESDVSSERGEIADGSWKNK